LQHYKLDREGREAIMVTTIIDWDGKQNVVVITDGTQTIRVPLDAFIELPAVQYVIELANEPGRRRAKHKT
jgi:hypothetical protein